MQLPNASRGKGKMQLLMRPLQCSSALLTLIPYLVTAIVTELSTFCRDIVLMTRTLLLQISMEGGQP